jgi:hypothetical protein
MAGSRNSLRCPQLHEVIDAEGETEKDETENENQAKIQGEVDCG